jgi:hypothetical protein
MWAFFLHILERPDAIGKVVGSTPISHSFKKGLQKCKPFLFKTSAWGKKKVRQT